MVKQRVNNKPLMKPILDSQRSEGADLYKYPERTEVKSV